MAMERWDPFNEMVNRMLGEWYSRPYRASRDLGYGLPLDVCEKDDEFIISASVPGVRPDDLDVTVKEDVLTIRGELKPPEWMQQQGGETPQQQQQQQMRGRGTQCWLQEIPYGRFTRSITMPTPVNGNNARAEFENGILTLHLPKAEEAKPRRIQIQAGGQRQQMGPGQEKRS